MYTLTQLSLQCPCCISHHTHTKSVWRSSLYRLLCRSPLEIRTDVLNPLFSFSLHSFFLISLHRYASNSTHFFHSLIHFFPPHLPPTLFSLHFPFRCLSFFCFFLLTSCFWRPSWFPSLSFRVSRLTAQHPAGLLVPGGRASVGGLV